MIARRRPLLGAALCAALVALVLVVRPDARDAVLVSVGAGPAPGTPAAGPDTVPYEVATAPLAFRERAALPSCGSYVVRQQDAPSHEPTAASACLAEARESGRGGELAVSQPTIEGRPVVTYTRVLPDRSWERFKDATADTYGPRDWTLVRCRTASDKGSPSGCGAPEELLAVPSPADGPCPDGSTELADYIDFVQVGGDMYVGAGQAPPGTRLGATAMHVRCELSEGARDREEPTQSGDAAYVPAGTPVRQVVGFDPDLRLAVEVDGEVRLYERERPSEPGSGVDVLPGVGPHVRAVLLLSHRDGETELARIDEPAVVADLVRDLEPAVYEPGRPMDADLFLGLLLDDGSTVRRAYDTRIGVLHPGLQLPPSFVNAIRAARERATR